MAPFLHGIFKLTPNLRIVFEMKSVSQLIVVCIVLVFSCTVFAEVFLPNVVGDPYEEDREYLTIEGFKVYVLPVQQYSWRGYTLAEREDERLRAIRKMTAQLKVAVSLLPSDPINKLRTKVVFYMDDTCEYGSVRRTGKKIKTGRIFYSPLTSKTGTDYKLGQIAVQCFSSFVHEFPFNGIVLHELAHAWQDLFIPNGFENLKINDQFVWSKKCLHLEHQSYWKTNVSEFFAEMTCAYFFRSKDVPFTDMSMSESNKSLIESAWQDVPKLENFEPSTGSCPSEIHLTLNPEAESLNKAPINFASH